MPELRLDRIDKYYGGVHAVKTLSLDVPAGEFVVLVGPSGCGKSTLLRCIAGLEEISGGDIILDGRPISALAPRRRNIAMVFQNYALYPYLDVFENIAFGLRARKASGPEIERKVRWASEVLHIEELLKRFPRELSGGQRQRVAIGRAIVRDADLFLFDEPLSNLDAKLRDGMREEIKRLHRELGKTFIYVTHDQIEAMTLAERIILLRDGRIEQVGAPLVLFENPADTFVAGFLGSPPMNFIEVTVRDGVVRLPDGQTIRCSGETGVPPDGSWIWGVRPEHFSRSETGAGAFAVVIEVVQPTGSRAYGSFSLGGVHAVAELDAHTADIADQRLTLSVAMDRTLFFHRESGASVTGLDHRCALEE